MAGIKYGTMGGRIKELRLAHGMTQSELAAAVGTIPQNIYKYENGTIVNIPLKTIVDLASVLKTTAQYLTGWQTEDENCSEAIPSRIPVLRAVAAGLPIYAEENIEGYICTEKPHPETLFALKVKGDSMNAANITDNSLVVVRKQDVVENGEIALVLVGREEATIKRFYLFGDNVTLVPQSFNPEHTPQAYDLKKNEVVVLGKVVQVIIDFE